MHNEMLQYFGMRFSITLVGLQYLIVQCNNPGPAGLGCERGSVSAFWIGGTCLSPQARVTGASRCQDGT